MPTPIHSIFYPFGIDKGSGTLKEQQDYAGHVEQMIRQVLLTNPGERINRPDFGCGLARMVFAPNNELTANLLNVMVLQSLQRWLSDLIEVNHVKISAINERLEVNIIYLLKARQERRYLNLEVTL